MTNFQECLELPNGGLFELYRDNKGREYAQLIARKRKGRWHEWKEITPRLSLLEDGVSRSDYSVAVLAYQIKKASKYKVFHPRELNRFAWKLSRLGFKKTAQRLSWVLKEPLNGYPIIPETPDKGFLFVIGSKEQPELISGELNLDNAWDFRLLRGLSNNSQELLLDDIALATVHDFTLRKLLAISRFPETHRETSRRRELHQAHERPLRNWLPTNGYRRLYAVNRHLKKERLTYSLVLKVHAGNGAAGAGKTGVYNNAMVKAADELTDTFDGKYKVEGVEAYFELATDLMKFSQKVRLNHLSSLTDSQVYLNITKDFDFG